MDHNSVFVAIIISIAGNVIFSINNHNFFVQFFRDFTRNGCT